jgi:hypothetical protein
MTKTAEHELGRRAGDRDRPVEHPYPSRKTKGARRI